MLHFSSSTVQPDADKHPRMTVWHKLTWEEKNCSVESLHKRSIHMHSCSQNSACCSVTGAVMWGGIRAPINSLQRDWLLNVKSSVSLMCCGLSRPGKESKTFQALRFLMCWSINQAIVTRPTELRLKQGDSRLSFCVSKNTWNRWETC